MVPRTFPRFGLWADWADQVDNEDTISYINHELSPCGIYLSDADIEDALRDLKDVMRSEKFGNACEDELASMMKTKLKKDRDSNGGQGLYRSRSRFLVFCYVARRTNFEGLARALLRFFGREGDDIVVEEKSFLLTEWCLGLRQLQGLVSEDKLRKAFRPVASRGPPLFEEWQRPGPHHSWIADILRYCYDAILFDHGRGRDHLQLLGPYDLPVRRLSVPACRRPSFVELPSYSRTGYNSPLSTPSHDLHALHLQQHMQAFELARLQRDVDDLRYRC